MTVGRAIWTWFEGTWHQGNFPIMGAADHGTWLGSMVFDGARAFEGTAPDLDLHCARTLDSAIKMGLTPPVETGEIIELSREGISKFPDKTGLYIRPMIWAREGGVSMVIPDGDSATFALCLEHRDMPDPNGFTVTTTRFSRPMHTMAPTDAKAGCLYPNNARMLREAISRGFDNAISLDPLGNVAETATSNIWMVKDRVAFTPIANGTFLAGITRSRVLQLLRDDGIEAVETTLTLDDFRGADEIFSTGNAQKVMPVTRFDDREFAYGPVTKRARALYWEYAHAAP
ncbi:MAG: branched-chain amino acid aminotransferase [Pseudomonadota bacterium]